MTMIPVTLPWHLNETKVHFIKNTASGKRATDKSARDLLCTT